MKMKESFSKKKENAAHQRGKISIYLSSKEYYTGWLDTQTQTHRVTSAESTSAANRHKPRRHHFKVFLPHSSVSRQLVDLIGRWNSLARPIKQVGMFPSFALSIGPESFSEHKGSARQFDRHKRAQRPGETLLSTTSLTAEKKIDKKTWHRKTIASVRSTFSFSDPFGFRISSALARARENRRRRHHTDNDDDTANAFNGPCSFFSSMTRWSFLFSFFFGIFQRFFLWTLDATRMNQSKPQRARSRNFVDFFYLERKIRRWW